MFIRCDVCRRYVELMLTSDVAERQVRRTSFSCVACGSHAALTGDDPAARLGYRLDPRDNPRRHPAAVARLAAQRRTGPAF
jgi:hypothetical protein